MSLSTNPIIFTVSMKTTLFFLLVLGSRLLAVPIEERGTDEYRRKLDQEREQQIQERARECIRSIEKATDLPPAQSIPIYGDVLMRLGGWQRPDTLAVYQEAQSKLITIPGHATYYRDKINELREQLLAGKLSLEDWDEKKSPYFRVLGHLPSEEAVEVLCGFAGDDFATGGFEDRKNAHIPGMKEWRFSDYDVDFTVCLPAIKALRSLQIDNAPSVEGIDAEKYALVWRQWWQEVKTGKRKYRFKGSDVWHPVNAPPGAERKIRRPDRHPGVPPAAGSPSRGTVSADAGTEVSGPASTKWFTLAGIAAVLIGMVVYFARRKSLRP